VVLAVIVLLTGTLGCQRKVPNGTSSRNQEPFITDRVVDVHIVMKEDDWISLQRNALEKQYVRADFWFDGELVQDVAVRPKGVLSLQSVYQTGSPRFSFKVDFNLLNSARTFRGLKKLNFNNGFLDPTYIRERLAYELFAQVDVPAPRASHVDLWINETHLGVYTQVEQIDKTFLRQHFTSNGGNLYKGAGPLNWGKEELELNRVSLAPEQLVASIDSQQIKVGGGRLSKILQTMHQQEQETKLNNDEILSPQPSDWLPGDPLLGLKTNEERPNHTALFRLVDVICNEPVETFPIEIEKVLDVDEFLRFLAVSALIGYLDSYLNHSSNTYLYEVDGKFYMIPWDMNEAFGIYGCKTDISGTWMNGTSRAGMINYYIDEPTCGPIAEFPLVERLLSYQPYLDTYHGYYETLLNGPFATDTMESRIDELANLIRPFVEREHFRLFLPGEFENSFTEDVRWAIGLKTFVSERNESVRQQLDGKRPSAGDRDGNGNMDVCKYMECKTLSERKEAK